MRMVYGWEGKPCLYVDDINLTSSLLLLISLHLRVVDVLGDVLSLFLFNFANILALLRNILHLLHLTRPTRTRSLTPKTAQPDCENHERLNKSTCAIPTLHVINHKERKFQAPNVPQRLLASPWTCPSLIRPDQATNSPLQHPISSKLLSIGGEVPAVLHMAFPPCLRAEDVATTLGNIGRGIQMEGDSEVAALVPNAMKPQLISHICHLILLVYVL